MAGKSRFFYRGVVDKAHSLVLNRRRDSQNHHAPGRCWLLVALMLALPGIASASITLTATVNGQPATPAPGVTVLVDSPVTWQYTLHNGRSKPLWSISIFQRPGRFFLLPDLVCTISRINPGESKSCSITRPARTGLIKSTGTALGTEGSTRFSLNPFSRGVVTYYKGVAGMPSLTLASLIDNDNADEPPGPELFRGNVFTHRQLITNSGQFDLSNVVISRRLISPQQADPEPLCTIDQLPIGEEAHCDTRTLALEGAVHYTVTATGISPTGGNATTENQDHYTGVATLSARPRATPPSGNAPLAVRFTPETFTDSAIQRYEWDFDGNGTFDRSETVGADQNYTYNAPGTYQVLLRVTDNRGRQATGTTTVQVTNAPPVVQAEASPSNGGAPLTVTFTATAQDSDGIDRYEWDFDGDGGIDQVVTVTTTSHTYTAQGLFRARVTVYDRLGAFTTIQVPTVDVEVREPGTASVTASATPATGNAPLSVNLGASVSDTSLAVTTWHWDVNGDGDNDYSGTNPGLSHRFEEIGTFYPRVTAVLADGSQLTDRVRVQANANLTLTRSRDTIDPGLGDTSAISTSLNGTLTAEVRIENITGQPVRRLFGPAERTAGTYQDLWDGRDDNGALVPSGQYRAVMLYTIDGVEQRLDPGLNTGGTARNPPRSSIPNSFSPFAGDPLEIDFTLSRASEVTAFMGLFNQNVRLVTFMDRTTLGTGTHRIVWNGEGDDGRLVQLPPNESFLFGIWSYDLPNNAIYVNSGVHASAVSVSPVLLTPGGLDTEGNPARAQIRFTLNRPGSVELSITDIKSGLPVARFTHDGLSSGQNSVIWDGRDNQGKALAPGQYRIGIAGLSDQGQKSITVHALLRIYY